MRLRGDCDAAVESSTKQSYYSICFFPKPLAAMNVLQITARADIGGGPEHLWQLLLHRDVTINIYVACPNDYPYFDRYVAALSSSRIVLIPHRRFSVRSIITLVAFCRQRRIDVVHAHGKGAGLYARALAIVTGIPVVYTFHGLHTGQYNVLKRFAYILYERIAARFTVLGIAVSLGERSQIVSEGIFPLEKLLFIPNGVAVPKVNVRRPKSKPLRVVSFTRFDAQKNTRFVLDIIAALEKRGRHELFFFELIGDGAERQAIIAEGQSRGYAGVVSCPGVTTTPSIYFKNAFAYLSTSLWEGMPLAVLEAMAHGIPVVVSDVVGNRDALCAGELGMLYDVFDPEAAADCLCRLVDVSGEWERLSDKARKHVVLHRNIVETAKATWAALRHPDGKYHDSHRRWS